VTGWHEGTLGGFDLETTGPDPETARIVTAAIVVRGAGRAAETAAWLVNPGIDIPAEATAVHGVTTEAARDGGADPVQSVLEISGYLATVMADDIPLVIYNAPYDLTVLDRETRRHGLTPFAELFGDGPGVVIDPFVLDKHLDPYRKGKRTLSAACEHYRVTLDGAHDASFDALAAMRVAWKIAATSPFIAAMSLGELHELQVKAKASQAASFQDYLRRQGKPEVVDGSWPFKTFAEVTP
jgi:DNA polymerase-3 subunit epsilon